MKDNSSLQNIDKENKYLQLQAELKNKLAQANASNIKRIDGTYEKQIQRENNALQAQANLVNKMYDKNQYKQSILKTNIDNALAGDISTQDEKALIAVRDGLNGIDLASDKAEQQIKEFNIAFKQLKSDIGTGKLVESGSIDIGLKSSKQEIAEYIANLKSIEASQVSIRETGRRTWDSQSQEIGKFSVEIKNADGSIDQLALSMKALKSGETEIRVLDKGFKDASVSADSLSKNVMKVVGYFVSFGSVISLIRSAFNTMKSIDTQLTELAKVTELVRTGFQKASLEAVEAGNKWGRTAEDYLKATTTFAQMGADNFKQLADVALLAQSAGSLTADLASILPILNKK